MKQRSPDTGVQRAQTDRELIEVGLTVHEVERPEADQFLLTVDGDIGAIGQSSAPRSSSSSSGRSSRKRNGSKVVFSSRVVDEADRRNGRSNQRANGCSDTTPPEIEGTAMKEHFALMAEYNAWANARLYRMAHQLPDEQYRREVGAYFKSLHGTLNHLLAADRIWMGRLTGAGVAPTRLDAILFDDLAALSEARRAEDERLVSFVATVTDAQLEAAIEYRMLNGSSQQQKLREVLAHLFNHQTHHRGQAHTILTVLGVKEPESLDVLWMLRERPAR